MHRIKRRGLYTLHLFLLNSFSARTKSSLKSYYKTPCELLLGALESQNIGPLRQSSDIDRLILTQSGAQQGFPSECAEKKRRFLRYSFYIECLRSGVGVETQVLRERRKPDNGRSISDHLDDCNVYGFVPSIGGSERKGSVCLRRVGIFFVFDGNFVHSPFP